MQLLKFLLSLSGEASNLGKRRVRQAALTGVATLLIRGISLTAGLISIPLTAKYLGQERFGLWLTLNTLITWVAIADLGLSNSLTNALATADGQDDRQQSSLLVSTATWLMLSTSVILTALFLVFYPLVPWYRVFNITSGVAKAEINATILVSFLFFTIRLPLSIPGRIYGAYQEGYFYQLWLGWSNLLSLLALILAVQKQAGLPGLLSAFLGALIIGDIISALHLFGWHKRWLRPKINVFEWQKSRWLLKTGLHFWVAQISSIALLQTDLVIVAQLFGASEVASYGVVLKLFAVIGAIQLAFLTPLWPAYSEALAKDDRSWIINTFKKTIFVSLIWSVLAGIILVFLTPQIVSAWVGENAIPSRSLVLAMFSAVVVTSVAQCIAMLLNGLGKVKIQAKSGLLAGIFNLLLSIILGNTVGPSGIAWATTFTIIIFSIGWVGLSSVNELKTFLAIDKTE
jgi:O-antigen/teichoic acid export membrane protein